MSILFLLYSCQYQEVEDCVCDVGYVRHDGACIPEANCGGCMINRQLVSKGASHSYPVISFYSNYTIFTVISNHNIHALCTLQALHIEKINAVKSVNALEMTRLFAIKLSHALNEQDVGKITMVSRNV